MEALATVVVAVYILSLLFIFVYSLIQLNLLVNYLRSKFKKKTLVTSASFSATLPAVTIQLPVYNELYVVERLLSAVTQLQYPKEKLEIQVLDDSTDETTSLLTQKIATFQDQFMIKHIRRGNRNGFKAGALAHGLEIATGEFIAIFDSDFLPNPDFLIATLSEFEAEKVGMVQTRWNHLNKDYSLLTRLQAFGLNAHFTIEQTGRNAAGHFINFNGTAGIWRKKCITDSGGWQSDTLTEDLDLSYRAQLRGWNFIYLDTIGTPAELPLAMTALKNQQFRWNKGAAECVKKNLGAVLKKKQLSLSTKLHAIFHLMNSTVFVFIMISALLSIPMLFIKKDFIELKTVILFAAFFLISFLILALFYFISLLQEEKKFPNNVVRFFIIFPLFLSVSMGLALHNAVAVLQGYFGKKTPFKRTPKFGFQSGWNNWKHNKYIERAIDGITVAEGLLSLYFTFGIVAGIMLKDYGLLPFHILLAFGFGFVCYYSIVHSGPVLSLRQPKQLAT